MWNVYGVCSNLASHDHCALPLDYGNSVLVGIPAHLLRRHQSVLNAAARLIFHLKRCDHIRRTCGFLGFSHAPRPRRRGTSVERFLVTLYIRAPGMRSINQTMRGSQAISEEKFYRVDYDSCSGQNVLTGMLTLDFFAVSNLLCYYYYFSY